MHRLEIAAWLNYYKSIIMQILLLKRMCVCLRESGFHPIPKRLKDREQTVTSAFNEWKIKMQVQSIALTKLKENFVSSLLS